MSVTEVGLAELPSQVDGYDLVAVSAVQSSDGARVDLDALRAAAAAAQTPVPGTLRVTVVDPSGAVIVDATVTVTGAEDGTRAVTPVPAKTVDTGIATVTGLTPGRYTIQAEFPGFETKQLPDVRVRSGENRQTDVVYKSGDDEDADLNMPRFNKLERSVRHLLKAQVIGVSKDSAARHDKFKAKYELTFPLVSDEDGKICERYGTWIEKSLYGCKYMGIERATFLIDKTGTITKIWHKVKVPGHVDEVLAALKPL